MCVCVCVSVCVCGCFSANKDYVLRASESRMQRNIVLNVIKSVQPLVSNPEIEYTFLKIRNHKKIAHTLILCKFQILMKNPFSNFSIYFLFLCQGQSCYNRCLFVRFKIK